MNSIENKKKSILVRACDPVMTQQASKTIPPQIGEPEYVATTSDDDFVDKLNSRDWSVIFFAPRACRLNEASQPIPGSNAKTQGWTLEQYRELVYETQGNGVQIVEAQEERETVGLLKKALAKARETSFD